MRTLPKRAMQCAETSGWSSWRMYCMWKGDETNQCKRSNWTKVWCSLNILVAKKINGREAQSIFESRLVLLFSTKLVVILFYINLSYLLYPVFIALHQVQKMLYHKIAWFLLHITGVISKLTQPRSTSHVSRISNSGPNTNKLGSAPLNLRLRQLAWNSDWYLYAFTTLNVHFYLFFNFWFGPFCWSFKFEVILS